MSRRKTLIMMLFSYAYVQL